MKHSLIALAILAMAGVGYGFDPVAYEKELDTIIEEAARKADEQSGLSEFKAKLQKELDEIDRIYGIEDEPQTSPFTPL